MGKGGSSYTGSAPAGNTTTTQTSSPWAGQVPYLQQQFGQAQNLFNNYTPQFFPQSTVAGFTPGQSQGLQSQINFGLGGGNSSLGAANNSLTNFENGNFLSAQNPYFQQTAQNVLGQVLPTIEGQFNQGGVMNSPGAAYAASQGATNAIAPYAFQNYQQGLQNMLQGAALAPGLNAEQQSNLQLATGAGAQQQAQNQAQLNDQIQRFNFQQMLPYQKLGLYQGETTGNFGGTSILQQPYFQNQAANNAALGAAAGKAGGSLLGGQSGGQTGAKLGLLGGGIGSDRRLKHVSGKHEGALAKLQKLTVYAARYKHEQADRERAMIMADEVEKIMPSAVAKGDDGMLMVDMRQLAPLIIGAVQELADRVSALESLKAA